MSGNPLIREAGSLDSDVSDCTLLDWAFGLICRNASPPSEFRTDVLSDVLKAVTFDGATCHHAECSIRSQRPHSQPSALCNRAQDYSHERPFRCAWS